MRTFYDSTTPGDLPATARFALRYVDGAYAESLAALKQRCPNLVRAATVTVSAANNRLDADMADCERGDFTPVQAAQWAAAKRAAGKGFPTIYCEDSQHGDVILACKQRGLTLGKHYLLFVANYNGQATIPTYAVGHQYRSPGVPGASSPGHYDVSVVRDYWRGVDPAPAPLTFLGVKVSAIKQFLAGRLAWVKQHPRKAKVELAAFFAALVSQPAVHALLHHQPYTAAGIISAVTAAVVAAARKTG